MRKSRVGNPAGRQVGGSVRAPSRNLFSRPPEYAGGFGQGNQWERRGQEHFQPVVSQPKARKPDVYRPPIVERPVVPPYQKEYFQPVFGQQPMIRVPSVSIQPVPVVHKPVRYVAQVEISQPSYQEQFNDACLTNKPERVRHLLRKHGHEIDVNEAKHSTTPLVTAILVGHIELAKILIDDYRTDLDVNSNIGTPFHLACSEGHLEIVRALLLKIDLNKEVYRDRKRSVVKSAFKLNDPDIISMVLAKTDKILIDVEDAANILPKLMELPNLKYKKIKFTGYDSEPYQRQLEEILQWRELLEIVDDNDIENLYDYLKNDNLLYMSSAKSHTLLSKACHLGYVEMARLLLEKMHGLEKQKIINLKSIKGYSPLYEASIRHDEELVQLLLEHMDVIVITNESVDTIFSVLEKQPALLNKKIKFQSEHHKKRLKDLMRKITLITGLDAGEDKVVLEYLDKINLNEKYLGKNRIYDLIIASGRQSIIVPMFHKVDIIELIEENKWLQIDILRQHQALLLKDIIADGNDAAVISEMRRLYVLECFKQSSSDAWQPIVDLINGQNAGHWNPLTWACEQNYQDVLKVIMTQLDVLRLTIKYEMSAETILDMLKRNKAFLCKDIQFFGVKGEYCAQQLEELRILELKKACFNGDVDTVRSLLATPRIAVNGTDQHGRSLLYWAVRKEHWLVVDLLLAHSGIDIVKSFVFLVQNLDYDFNKENQHEKIAAYIIEKIDKVEHPQHLLALMKAIGIGRNNQKDLTDCDDNLGRLRFRRLYPSCRMGFRETNDSELIARAIINRAKAILKDQSYNIESEKEYVLFKDIFNKQICRSDQPEEREDLLAWYDATINKAYEKKAHGGFNL